MKRIYVLIAVLFMAAATACPAMAADPVEWPWYQGTITKITTYGDGNIAVNLKQATGDDVNLYIDESLSSTVYNRFLSIALTAFSRGSTVNLMLKVTYDQKWMWGCIQVVSD